MFEWLIETVIWGLTYESCLLYQDDVIMIGRLFQEHLLNLWKEFQLFWEAYLKLNLEKCQLFQDVRDLRHTVSPEGDNHQTRDAEVV
jgi:hypothetical protein